ncbi:MAG: ABC transporter permease, partial [Calditrichaeota bacterium]
FLDAGLILTIGVGIFKVPFVGNPLLLLAYSLLYVITGLSLGLLFSTIAPTQQVAMMMALTATLLPTIVLSGFIFPIPSMPRVLQWISHLIPARYFLPMVRGVMLKGNTADQLLVPTIVLAFMAVLLISLARRKFKTDLED